MPVAFSPASTPWSRSEVDRHSSSHSASVRGIGSTLPYLRPGGSGFRAARRRATNRPHLETTGATGSATSVRASLPTRVWWTTATKLTARRGKANRSGRQIAPRTQTSARIRVGNTSSELRRRQSVQTVAQPPAEAGHGLGQVQEAGERAQAKTAERPTARCGEVRMGRAGAGLVDQRSDPEHEERQRREERVPDEAECRDLSEQQQQEVPLGHERQAAQHRGRRRPWSRLEQRRAPDAVVDRGAARTPMRRRRVAVEAARPRRRGPARCTSRATCARAAPRPCRSRLLAPVGADGARRWCQTSAAGRSRSSSPRSCSRQQTSTSSPARGTAGRSRRSPAARRAGTPCCSRGCARPPLGEQHVHRPARRVARRTAATAPSSGGGTLGPPTPTWSVRQERAQRGRCSQSRIGLGVVVDVGDDLAGRPAASPTLRAALEPAVLGADRARTP